MVFLRLEKDRERDRLVHTEPTLSYLTRGRNDGNIKHNLKKKIFLWWKFFYLDGIFFSPRRTSQFFLDFFLVASYTTVAPKFNLREVNRVPTRELTRLQMIFA